MNNPLQVLWWFIFLGPIFKVWNMWGFIHSIDAEKELKLPKRIRDWILGVIGVLSLVIGTELTIHGLTLLAYILITIAAFFIMFLISNFFNNHFLYNFLVIIPTFAFLGYWTGGLSVEVKSPYYLEWLIITIPFILPYIQYKLVFSKPKLMDLLGRYLQFLDEQALQIRKIDEVRKDLLTVKKLYSEYLASESTLKRLERELSIKIIHTSHAEKDPLGNVSYQKLKNNIKLRTIVYEQVSEMLSILSNGLLISGSSEEGIIKSIGHFNQFLLNPEKINFFKMYKLEYTKSKRDILTNIRYNHFLMFLLKYQSNSSDYFAWFNTFKKYAILEEIAWKERNIYSPLTDSEKVKLETESDNVKKIERYLKGKKPHGERNKKSN